MGCLCEGMGVWGCFHHCLCMCGVCGGGGGGQTWGAKQPTDQPRDYPTHLPMHQHTNHTTAQQERGGGLLDVLKKKICNLLEPTCSGGSSNNWLERHWNIAEQLTRTQPGQRFPKV